MNFLILNSINYVGSHYYFNLKVLEDSLNWLDEWESYFDSKNITQDEFLTRSTSEGLRVTIKSTLELSKYLLNDCGFKYVLTNKMNQDRLEVILGNILLL